MRCTCSDRSWYGRYHDTQCPKFNDRKPDPFCDDHYTGNDEQIADLKELAHDLATKCANLLPYAEQESESLWQTHKRDGDCKKEAQACDKVIKEARTVIEMTEE